MNSHEHVHDDAHAPQMARRDFLRKSSTLAIPLVLGGTALPAMAAYVPPTRNRGSTVRNVRYYGAFGDGKHDDTAAIQAAINSLPSTGGTVYVPAGTYLIDTTRKIYLRSLMLLKLDPGAILKAKTSSVRRAYILYAYNVSDVEVAGGQLVGERDTHKYLTTSTDEWNHGMQIIGCKRVTVRDLRVAKCTGDGICIGGGSSDVVIANIVSTQNRRQGLSITWSSNVKVYDSEFSYTNGTKPGCGIDVEPDVPYSTSNVWIENCWLHHNAGNGIQVYKRVSGVTVRACTAEYNNGYGVLCIANANGRIIYNKLLHNRLYGVGLRAATNNYKVYGNGFRNNKTLYFGVTNTTAAPIKVTGTSTTTFPKTNWHLEIASDCYAIYVGTNYYAQ